MKVDKSLSLGFLRKLVHEGEGQRLEFKLKTHHPDKIMKEVVAFANTDGGYLVLGVADDGEIKGLKFPEEDKYVISQSMEKYVEPSIEFTLDEILLENGRTVLIYKIAKNTSEVVYFNPHDQSEKLKIYVRNNDRSIQASREVRQILKEELKNKSYRFQFGEKENKLVKYLDEHQFITLNQFKELAEINSGKASGTLVLLVLTGVLKIIPEETEDLYILNYIK